MAGPAQATEGRPRETASPRRLRLGTLSLRAQVALVIALLSALPNLFMVVAILLPNYRMAGALDARAWLTVSLWLAGVVVLAGLVGYFLSGVLLAPLLKTSKDVLGLPRIAEQLAAGRLPLADSDPAEVTSLRRSFNELLGRIELEQERRNAFIAALMHDLKTPLVATTNLLQVVEEDSDLSREKRIEIVSRVRNEIASLTELVQKLVDAHRLERTAALSREQMDLGELTRRVAQRLEPLALERGVEVTVEGSGAAWADARELERALYNLLSNGVRYAKSRIEVGVYPGMVRVHDDGPGLPAPLEELAQPFVGHNVSIAGRTYAGGTGGLGLYIARRVLEAHGGRLVCEATSPRGTVLLAFVGGTAGEL